MQIRSFEEYTSLTDYSQKLKEAVNKVRNCPLQNRPKQMDSFIVTLDNLHAIMNDIKEVKRLLNDIASIPVMDLEAKKENKNAKKVEKIINAIKKRLRASYERLQKEFLRQFKIAKEQHKKVVSKLETRENKELFSRYSNEFLKMASEAQTKNFKLPFDKKDEMAELKANQTKRAHEQKSKQLDNTMKSLDNTDGLLETLNSLAEVLAHTPRNEASNNIRKEFAGIRKAKPPKMIAVAKSTLDSLCHSQQLSLDIEEISRIMGTNVKDLSNDKKLQKAAEQIKKLGLLLEKAKKSEEERYETLKGKNGTAYGMVQFSEEAAKTYINILAGEEKTLPVKYTDMKRKLQKMSTLLSKKDKKGVTR